MAADHFEIVRAVLCREFELEPAEVQPGSLLKDDLDLDSVDAVALLVRLEEETGLRLREEQLKALRTVDDVARTVLFLASDASDFITGEMVNVDGGVVPTV